MEISPSVADNHVAVILDQVTNGVSVRMALMYLLSGFMNVQPLTNNRTTLDQKDRTVSPSSSLVFKVEL